MPVDINKVLEQPRSDTLWIWRQQYLKDVHSRKSPWSTQMVPTWAFGEVNMCLMHFGWDLNHCNSHLALLAERTKAAINAVHWLHANMAAAPGVSDGISNGSPAMRASLASRDHMTVDITNHYIGTPYHGLVLIPWCDKNMPAAAMSLFYLNDPWFILCGGSIRPGEDNTDIVSVFQGSGKKDRGEISNEEYIKIHKKSCPGPWACGWMYTANSMFTIFEAMGITPAHNSSTLAEDKIKGKDIVDIPSLAEDIVENHRIPSSYITKSSFENAVRILCVLWGSTNPVLHLLAMAQATKNWENPVEFTEVDIERISKETPFIGNLSPNGEHRMKALSDNGGTPTILRYMLENGHLDGSQKTLTGKTLEEELNNLDDEEYNKNIKALLEKNIIKPFEDPFLNRGHLVYLDGNMWGGWTKVSNAGLSTFEWEAVVFESEDDFLKNYLNKWIWEWSVIVIRNVWPKGAPWMPEMLTPTSKIIGNFGMDTRIALMTDGRFSWGSVWGAPIIGHMEEDWLIRLIKDGDIIVINPETNAMNLTVSDEEIRLRETQYVVRERIEKHVPLSLRQFARGNPNPRTWSLSIDFEW